MPLSCRRPPIRRRTPLVENALFGVWITNEVVPAEVLVSPHSSTLVLVLLETSMRAPLRTPPVTSAQNRATPLLAYATSLANVRFSHVGTAGLAAMRPVTAFAGSPMSTHSPRISSGAARGEDDAGTASVVMSAGARSSVCAAPTMMSAPGLLPYQLAWLCSARARGVLATGSAAVPGLVSLPVLLSR